MKSQTALDVFALGPFMVWFGVRSPVPLWARTAMVFAGVATIIYNAQNYRDRMIQAGRPRAIEP